jgi:N-succinyldiaminopimelate aminotransferase
MKPVNLVVDSFKESIFSTITQLSNAHQAINLAQGFPDFDGPSWVRDLAKAALSREKNQYAPSYGIPSLRAAIARNYEKHYSLSYDPAAEILVTNGATEAIYCAVKALVNPGDEVVVFEPLYDSYAAALQLARAEIKIVTLKAPDFNYELVELKAAVNSKTKLLILNNPHNPAGKVFTVRELDEIAALARENDFYVMSDEVYEFLTFENKHVPIASLPGMKDRVITISSIGKTLSLTGWKIGWACGPAALIKAAHNVHQFVSFCVAHPLQEAIAEALPRMDAYLAQFRAAYAARRILLVDGLKARGYDVRTPQGTYFAVARIPEGREDVEYCRELIVAKKVAAIPMSAFYLRSGEGRKLIRFCFAKKEETLRKALERLGPSKAGG